MKLQLCTPSDTIIQFLKQDEILNLNMLGILKSTPQAQVYVDDPAAPSGVYIQANDYFAYLYTQSTAFADAVCDTFMTEGYHGFSGVAEDMAKYILSKFEEDWLNPCTLYYLPKENFDPSLQQTPAETLPAKWAELVDQNYPYSNNHSLMAITDNLTQRPSSAIFIDGQPVCWVMIHEDDSMGIMHTMEEHRRKGYAVDVTIDLCRQLFERGETPFLQIVEGNSMSPGLALKCGFVPYKPIAWFGVKVGNPTEEA